jgi:hypothetical protein
MKEIISIDDIKYLAQQIYGNLPMSCNFVQKTYTLSYPSANEFSNLLVLENPIFVTNAQVSVITSEESGQVYISASADNSNDLTAFNLGTDGDVLNGGAVWKYLKVSGNLNNGGGVQITLTGYELGYSGGSTPSEETFVRSKRINVTSAMATNGYVLVNENIVISTNSLVFANGVLCSTSAYTLNAQGTETAYGYITFADGFLTDGDEICVLY